MVDWVGRTSPRGGGVGCIQSEIESGRVYCHCYVHLLILSIRGSGCWFRFQLSSCLIGRDGLFLWGKLSRIVDWDEECRYVFGSS